MPDLANRLAPSMFREAKSLVAGSLLETPQSLEFFQATIVLSLWSTTIGHVPLSVDSWLLTGFALQHGMASHHFGHIFESRVTGLTNDEVVRWRIWNHLCIAHLQ